MTPTNGAMSVADYIPRGGNVWAARLRELRPEDLLMPEPLAAMYFASSDSLPRRRSFQDRGLAQASTCGPESSLIATGATRASC